MLFFFILKTTLHPDSWKLNTVCVEEYQFFRFLFEIIILWWISISIKSFSFWMTLLLYMQFFSSSSSGSSSTNDNFCFSGLNWSSGDLLFRRLGSPNFPTSYGFGLFFLLKKCEINKKNKKSFYCLSLHWSEVDSSIRQTVDVLGTDYWRM